MVEIGQLAIKIAGRDGGNFCAIVDKIDDNFVLIDGNVRRKKCNIGHLEFLDKSGTSKHTRLANPPNSRFYFLDSSPISTAFGR